MNRLIFLQIGILVFISTLAYGEVTKKRIHKYTYRADIPSIGVTDIGGKQYRLNADSATWDVRTIRKASKHKTELIGMFPKRRDKRAASIFEYNKNGKIVSAAILGSNHIEYESKDGFVSCADYSGARGCYVMKKELCKKLKNFFKGQDVDKRLSEINKCDDDLGMLDHILSLKSEKLPRDVEKKIIEYTSRAGGKYSKAIKLSNMKIFNREGRKDHKGPWFISNLGLTIDFCKEYGYMEDTPEPSSYDSSKKSKSKTISR